MEHTLRIEQWIDLPREQVFSFFSDAMNLELITPPELKFRILSTAPIELRKGALIDYQLRLAGIPFKWKTEITDWNPPYSFVDTQLKGPYTQWIHTHEFEEIDGRTRIRDQVRYVLPLSPISDLAYPLVMFQLQRIFAFRRAAVSAHFAIQD